MHEINIYCRQNCSRTAFPDIAFEKCQQTFLHCNISLVLFITSLYFLLQFLFIFSNKGVFAKNMGPASRYIFMASCSAPGPGGTEFSAQKMSQWYSRKGIWSAFDWRVWSAVLQRSAQCTLFWEQAPYTSAAIRIYLGWKR